MVRRRVNKYATLWSMGGLLYIALELLWRGYSHWTMFILGGLCFIGLGLINEVLPWDMPLWQQILLGADRLCGQPVVGLGHMGLQ